MKCYSTAFRSESLKEMLEKYNIKCFFRVAYESGFGERRYRTIENMVGKNHSFLVDTVP